MYWLCSVHCLQPFDCDVFSVLSGYLAESLIYRFETVVVSCALCAVHCSLCTVFFAQCTIFFVLCVQFSLHCAQCSVALSKKMERAGDSGCVGLVTAPSP